MLPCVVVFQPAQAFTKPVQEERVAWNGVHHSFPDRGQVCFNMVAVIACHHYLCNTVGCLLYRYTFVTS